MINTKYGPVIDLNEWLETYATDHPELTATWADWEPQDDHVSRFDMGEQFMLEQGHVCVARDNTCNNENDFDNDFVWEVWTLAEDETDDWIYCDGVVVIYPRNNNYGGPMFLTFDENEYVLPLNWQCDLYSESLTDEQNDQLSVGYSSSPLGQLESFGYELIDDEGTAEHNETGEHITILADYWL